MFREIIYEHPSVAYGRSVFSWNCHYIEISTSIRMIKGINYSRQKTNNRCPINSLNTVSTFSSAFFAWV